MSHRYVSVPCVLSLVLSIAGSSGATVYSFTTLSPTGSDTQSCATGLALVGGIPTAAGYVGTEGGSEDLGPGSLSQLTPVTWNAAGTGTSILGELPGSPINAYGWGIDGTGDVVGSERTTGPNAVNAFFLPAGATTATALPVLNSGDAWVAAFGVQNSSNRGRDGRIDLAQPQRPGRHLDADWRHLDCDGPSQPPGAPSTALARARAKPTALTPGASSPAGPTCSAPTAISTRTR